MKMYQLNPQFENVSSYYGKAIVILDNGNQILLSYGLPIAIIDSNNNCRLGCTTNDLSHTTLRHLKEFLKQNGIFEFKTKSDIKYMPIENLTKYNGIIEY